jgi:hypothetical protein
MYKTLINNSHIFFTILLMLIGFLLGQGISENFSGVNTDYVYAQSSDEPDAACIATATASYMDSFFSSVGSTSHIKYLSPVFNLTSSHSEYDSFVEIIKSASSWSRLDGYAGNAYNFVDGRTITDWLDIAYSWGLNDPTKDFFLTETGAYQLAQNPNYDRGIAIDSVIGEFSNLGRGRYANVKGAALFNVFGTSGDPEFFYAIMTDDEARRVCAPLEGSMAVCGANSAVQYVPGDTRNPDGIINGGNFYSKASGAGMKITVSIATDGTPHSAVVDEIKGGFTPIVRIGWGGPDGGSGGGFENPADYAAWVRGLDSAIASAGGGTAYVIVGPNEPLTDCWVAQGQCGKCGTDDGDSEDVTITFRGKVRSSLPVMNSSGNEVSGQPVRGAVIGLYEGTWDTDIGTLYGNVRRYNYSATDSDGNYVVEGVRRANGGSFNNSMYMLVWCGADYVDGYEINLSETDVVWDLVVPCNRQNYESPPRPRENFNLGNMGPPLACGPVGDRFLESPDSLGGAEIAPGHTKPIRLVKRGEDSRFYDIPIREDGSNLPPVVTETNVDFEGRNDLAEVFSSYSELVKLYGTYYRGYTTPLLEGQTADDLLPNCEAAVCSCNRQVADPSTPGSINSHTCYSQAATLASPGITEILYPRALTYSDREIGEREYSALQEEIDAGVPLHQQSVKPTQKPVCKTDTGERVYLDQFEPPAGFPELVDGPYKYESACFPYLFVVGDPFVGTFGQNYNDSMLDSYDPVSERIPVDTSRQIAFGQTNEQPNQQTWSHTEMQAGNCETSNDCTEALAQDTLGLGNGLAAVAATPGAVFGYEEGNTNPQLSTSQPNINKVGSGDNQIGRPFQLCSVNHYDTGYSQPLDRYDCNVHTTDEGVREYCSGYQYITRGGILDAIIDFFKRLFSEEIRVEDSGGKVYYVAEVGHNTVWVEYPPPNQNALTESSLSSQCVEWRESDFLCDTDDLTCRYAKCTWVDVDNNFEPISSCTESDCGKTSPEGYAGICNYENPWYVCRGDVIALFEDRNKSVSYAPFDRADAAAMLNASLSWSTPGDNRRNLGGIGTATLSNIEVQNQEEPGKATDGAIHGGAGGTESKYGVMLSSFSSPIPEGEYLAPPEFSESIYSTGPGSGKCEPAPAGSPCDPARLAQYFGEENAINASIICNRESGAYTQALNDRCLRSTDGIDNDGDGLIDFNDPDYDGATVDFSVGLFQINLLAHGGDPFVCPDGDPIASWSWGPPPTCSLTSTLAANKCIDNIQDVSNDGEKNILKAVSMFKSSGWGPWSAAKACGIN